MRLVFAGTPAVALPFLDAIAASRHDLAAVITRPDAPQGRSKRPVPSPVADWSSAHGVETLKPARPSDKVFQQRLRELRPDCVPVVAYGALVPDEVLAIPAHGWVNVHFSLLPAWRGAAPVQRAVMAGDAETGLSIFRLVKALDAGPVYRQVPSALGPEETAGDVLGRLSVQGAGELLEVLDAIEAGSLPVPQPDEGASVAPKLTPDEVRLDWTLPAEALARTIRGANPSPMAWTTLGGQRFRVLRGRPVEGSAEPGRVLADRTGVRVGTGHGLLELETVQPPGRAAMRAGDWARGLREAEPWLGR